MDVREATPEDAPGVRHVAEVSWHAAHDDIVGAEAVQEFLAKHYQVEDLRERFRTGGTTTFVAEDPEPAPEANGIVGYAGGAPSDDAYNLGAIYVHPDWQGEGVGGRLLECVEQRGREEGFDTLRLVVMAANDGAIGFYEANGFACAAERDADAFDVRERVYEKPL